MSRPTPAARPARIIRRRLVKASVTLVAVVAGLFAIVMPAQAAPTNDYSFYKLASVSAAYFGNTMSPGSSDKLSSNVNPIIERAANGGDFMGFADANISDVWQWLQATVSGSSQSYSYESLTKVKGDGSAASSNGMLDYAQYGATLSALGLDSTSTSLSLGWMRTFSGGIMFVLYLLSMTVDVIFSLIFKVLQILNPFKLFYQGVSAAFGSSLANGMVGDSGAIGPDNPLYGLVNWIGGWYAAMASLSWAVIIPVFLGILLVSVVLFKAGDRGSKIRKFCIRAVFIVLGIPLLGSLYSASIDSMAGSTIGGTGSMGATKVILSTYVDFGSWASQDRLAVPNGCPGSVISWDTANDQPSGMARANLRNTALCINNQTGRFGNLGSMISAQAASSVGDAATDTAKWDTGLSSNTTDSSVGVTTVGNTIAMLFDYMNGVQYTGSSFETGVKADISAMESNGFSSDTANGWFNDYAQADALKNKSAAANPVMTVASGTGLYSSSNGSVKTFGTATSTGLTCGQGGMSGYAVANSAGQPIACNMSALGMYNYLNTSFGSSSMTVYSSQLSTSGMTREMHNSVSQIGTGTMSVLYWLNAAVLLFCFVVIGWSYAFSIVINNIKRTFQLVAAVPFATLGSLSAITKVLVYAIVMVLEIMTTMFIYNFVQEFLLSLSQIIEAPLAMLLNNDHGSVGALAFLATSGWSALIVMIAAIVTTAWFTITAIRVRKSVVTAISEVATKIVERFTESGMTPPTGHAGGGLGRAAAAVGSGAMTAGGMALTQKMLNGGFSGGASAATPTSSGPSSVKVDGIPKQGMDPQQQAGIGAGGLIALPAGPGTGPDGMLVPGPSSGPDGGGQPGAGPDDTAGDPSSNVVSDGTATVGQSMDSGEAADRRLGDAVLGKGKLSDSTLDDAAKAARKVQRGAQARAGARTVVGGAKAVVGAYTGNVGLAAAGAQQAARGVQGVQASSRPASSPSTPRRAMPDTPSAQPAPDVRPARSAGPSTAPTRVLPPKYVTQGQPAPRPVAAPAAPQTPTPSGGPVPSGGAQGHNGRRG